MEHVTFLDILIIFAYLLGMLFIGFYFTKSVKTAGDFFVAGRSLGPVVLMATVCASIIGGSALIGRGGYAYNGGMVAIAIALPYMIGMFIFSCFTGMAYIDIDNLKQSNMAIRNLRLKVPLF